MFVIFNKILINPEHVESIKETSPYEDKVPKSTIIGLASGQRIVIPVDLETVVNRIQTAHELAAQLKHK